METDKARAEAGQPGCANRQPRGNGEHRPRLCYRAAELKLRATVRCWSARHCPYAAPNFTFRRDSATALQTRPSVRALRPCLRRTGLHFGRWRHSLRRCGGRTHARANRPSPSERSQVGADLHAGRDERAKHGRLPDQVQPRVLVGKPHRDGQRGAQQDRAVDGVGQQPRDCAALRASRSTGVTSASSSWPLVPWPRSAP